MTRRIDTERRALGKTSSTQLAKRAPAVVTDDGETVVYLPMHALPAWTAFESMYDRYHNQIYQFCLRRLGNSQDAEDATSTIFFGAWTSYSKLKGNDARPWLFSIAFRVVANHFRTRPPTQPLDDACDDYDPAPGPEDRALSNEIGQSLRELLANLSNDERQIIELRLAGFTSAEIGVILGRNPGAVDTAHHRALSRLKRVLVLGKEDRNGSV